MINKLIYQRLYKLLPDLDTIREHQSLQADGYMDLGVDIQHSDSEYIVLALSHYWKHPSGDMIPDPDMVLLVRRSEQQAEALTYQDMYRYDEVYPGCNPFAGDFPTKKQALSASLNAFLAQWLQNLIQQGHKPCQ